MFVQQYSFKSKYWNPKYLSKMNTQKIKINPVSLIFLKIFIMGLVGISSAFFFDIQIPYFIKNLNDKSFIYISVICTFYAFIIMIFLYYTFDIKKIINFYSKKGIIYFKPKTYIYLWIITFVLCVSCFGYAYYQTNWVHPGVLALESSDQAIKLIRHDVEHSVNMNVFNLGFKLFLPINLTISLFFLKRKHWAVISFVLFVIMGTFTLKRSNMVYVVMFLLFFKMLLNQINLKTLFKYFVGSICLITVMYLLAKSTGFESDIFIILFRRIVYGEIASLPNYFEIFHDNHLSFYHVLPPYFSNIITGESLQSSAKIVMQHINPMAISRGTAGSAPTLFIGEAYAIWGYMGVIIFPVYLMMIIIVIVNIFTRMKKNFITLSIFSFTLVQIFSSIFSGVGRFVFSGTQMVLFLFLYYFIIHLLAKESLRVGRYHVNKENINFSPPH